jgi:hypothetical protein
MPQAHMVSANGLKRAALNSDCAPLPIIAMVVAPRAGVWRPARTWLPRAAQHTSFQIAEPDNRKTATGQAVTVCSPSAVFSRPFTYLKP